MTKSLSTPASAEFTIGQNRFDKIGAAGLSNYSK